MACAPIEFLAGALGRACDATDESNFPVMEIPRGKEEGNDWRPKKSGNGK